MSKDKKLVALKPIKEDNQGNWVLNWDYLINSNKTKELFTLGDTENLTESTQSSIYQLMSNIKL